MSLYNLALTVAPTLEPVTVGEAKDHLKVGTDITEDDDLIAGMITAARQLAETQTKRVLMTQTWSVGLRQFPGSWRSFDPVNFLKHPLSAAIALPLAPIQSVAWVHYYDEANALQTLDAALYEADLRSQRAVIAMVSGQTWPATFDRLQAVEISVIAGYGDEAEDVPRSIRQWILAALGDMYEHRTITRERSDLTINPFLDGLLDPYRIVEI